MKVFDRRVQVWIKTGSFQNIPSMNSGLPGLRVDSCCLDEPELLKSCVLHASSDKTDIFRILGMDKDDSESPFPIPPASFL